MPLEKYGNRKTVVLPAVLKLGALMGIVE